MDLEDGRQAFGQSETPELTPRYDIAPSQPVAVLRSPGRLDLLRWGLVPSWADDVSVGHRLILAHAETAVETET